jgi:hypothetical protein
METRSEKWPISMLLRWDTSSVSVGDAGLGAGTGTGGAVFVDARYASDVWWKCATEVLSRPEVRAGRSRKGESMEFVGVVVPRLGLPPPAPDPEIPVQLPRRVSTMTSLRFAVRGVLWLLLVLVLRL